MKIPNSGSERKLPKRGQWALKTRCLFYLYCIVNYGSGRAKCGPTPFGEPPPRKWWQRYIVDPLKIGMHLVTIPLTNL